MIRKLPKKLFGFTQRRLHGQLEVSTFPGKWHIPAEAWSQDGLRHRVMQSHQLRSGSYTGPVHPISVFDPSAAQVALILPVVCNLWECSFTGTNWAGSCWYLPLLSAWKLCCSLNMKLKGSAEKKPCDLQRSGGWPR